MSLLSVVEKVHPEILLDRIFQITGTEVGKIQYNSGKGRSGAGYICIVGHLYEKMKE